jgi:NAD(P)-dependent dehydrogenase (short-subunit alcohol dehydrogenase family)
MNRLQHKVALVTGAARGIGGAIAQAFAAEGARVIVSDIDEAAGRATAERLGAAWLKLDVREELAWIGAMARVLDSHGRLDVLVNNAGITGFEAGPAAAAYAASKAAVVNHTRSVALYCAEQRLPVRCNAILPAAVLTPMWEPMLGDGDGGDRAARMAELVADTPLRRFAQPAEVAALAVLLASDECLYMTGSELHVDGGLLAGSAAVPRS